ncbi:MAG: serpin family protein [Planctomycetota bacterium]|jgi:serpin B
MKAIKCVFVLALVTASAACCIGADEPSTKETSDQEVLVEGNNRFALDLYAKLREEEGNLFFSPYSISAALTMAYAGARGETAVQMADVLALPKDEANQSWRQERVHSVFGAVIRDLNRRGGEGRYELTVANALWGQEGYWFLNEFLELIEAHYDGQLHEVDFIGVAETARRTINTWVEKETRDKIKNLIPPGALNSLMRLVLTNAIYFKGNWARQFEKDKTIEAPFTLTSGKKVNAPMMNQTENFGYMEADDFQALEMPYVDNELSMIILLPKKFDGLDEFEKKIKPRNLSDWLTKLRSRKVIVSFPKFKMTSQFGLAGVLRSMGMRDAFSQQADFSGMNGSKDLYISAVIHKAYVDVNEEGTEAAAATGVVVGVTAIPAPQPVFRADHPFLFLIRDNHTGSILFIGRVMAPTLQS